MAKKQKPATAPADNALKDVSDYRFPEATRKNNPPAKIAAEGYVPLIPKAEYLYSPRRPPELRFDPTGTADTLLALQSRHQLFPQVFRYVDEYVRRKVNFQNCNTCELGLAKYVERMVERLRDGIVPDDSEGEAPLMPITNRYKPIGTTAEVDFKTTRACHATMKSHIDQVVLDNQAWESSAGFRLESSHAVQFYARNDHMGLTIPYEYMGIDHAYEPDFLVRLSNAVTVVLEIKGFEDDQTKAKHTAANRWVEAVNNWGQLRRWAFHVCRNPQLLHKEMEYLARAAPVRTDALSEVPTGKVTSPLSELSERSRNYVWKHFGTAVKWSLINEAIWSALEVRKDQTISLTEVDEVAKVASVEPNEVLALLAVLSRPASGLLKMEYLASGGGKTAEVSRDEVGKRLRAWWRDKTMPDDEWRSWAGSVVVKWRAADGEDAAE